MKMKRILIIVSVALLAVVILSSVWQANRKNSKGTPASSANIAYENGPVSLQNTDSLSKILLQSQFNAVVFSLSGFIQNRVDSSVTSAAVVGDPSVSPDGTVSFSVALNNAKKQSFAVSIDRSTFSSITIKIPAYNFCSGDG